MRVDFLLYVHFVCVSVCGAGYESDVGFLLPFHFGVCVRLYVLKEILENPVRKLPTDIY